MNNVFPIQKENTGTFQSKTNLPFWFWDGAMQKSFCDDFFESIKKEKFTPGIVGNNETFNKKIRSNSVLWLPRMHLIECILSHFTREANASMGWNFDLSIVFDKAQIAKYEPKQEYKIHNDLIKFSGTLNNLERKMSAVMLLSDEKDYTGGDLEIMGEVIPTRKQGTIIVFPSFLSHRVTPVKTGTRYSATCWIAGPAFR